jgi:MFS family permease
MGLIFWSIMTALSGFAMSFVHLLLLRIGVAVGEAAAGPPAQSLISDYFPRHRRATALSIYGLGGSLGAIVGLWLGGILVTEYGWRTAFWALGAPGVAVALVFYWSVREPVRGAMDIAPQQNEQSSFKEVCWHLLSMPSFRYLMLGASFSMFAHFGVNMWDVTFVRRIHGVTAEEAGRALGLVHMLAIPSGLLGAILADKFGKKDIRFYMWLPAASALFGAPFTLAFILSNDFQSAIIFAAVGMAVGSWWMGASLATVQNLAAPHMRALAAAIFTLTYNMVGMGLGPSVVGWITDAFAATHGDEAIRFAFLFSIIPLTLSGLCFLMVAKHLKQDIQE